MRVDYIYNIIGKLKELPYKCIMFDGAWGIGKTYTIEKALEKNENVCKISLFGLQNSQQIYHEALFQLIFKNGKVSKAAGVALGVLDKAISMEGISFGKDIIKKVAKEKELFLLYSRSFSSPHVILIDDLERIGERTSLEEVLGIVEELKKCNYVKVILVANTEEFKEADKNILEKYSEKVIDKIYHITEQSENIDWKELDIDACFIRQFLSEHKVSNLRTLQKAQRFYEDVSLHNKKIVDQEFLYELKWICYAIVVESIDNLYYNPKSDEFVNDLEVRISAYLARIKSRNLAEILFKFYKNEIILTPEELEEEYNRFLQDGAMPNFYKTDVEIANVLDAMEKDIDNIQDIYQLNSVLDEYIEWSEIIGNDDRLMMEKYKTKLHDILLYEVENEDKNVLSVEHYLYRMRSEKLKKIYKEERAASREALIMKYVQYLKRTPNGEKAFVYSQKLRDYSKTSEYRDIIKDALKELYTRGSFPIDVKNNIQYNTCYNIVSVLYDFEPEKLAVYAEKLATHCDKMAAFRIRDMIRLLEKEKDKE